MNITVRLFASLREGLGASVLDLEAPESATVASVIDRLSSEHPNLAAVLSRTVAAVNMDYVDREQPLRNGDELALIPPVSGGARPLHMVTPEPLDASAAAALVRKNSDGAVVTFEGVVRDNAAGKQTSYLEYDAYPEMAVQKMAEIAAEVNDRWGIEPTAIWHRTGRLEIGETSLVIALAAPHRAEAFEASAYCVDRVKELLPIWKKEVGPDGSFWVEGSVVERPLPR